MIKNYWETEDLSFGLEEDGSIEVGMPFDMGYGRTMTNLTYDQALDLAVWITSIKGYSVE